MRLSKQAIIMIAMVCHEVNRSYCQATGDDVQPSWADAPEELKEGIISGVNFYIGHIGATPEEMHENWMKEKLEKGWKHGEKKDPKKKTHPNIMPFKELPLAQQVKDSMFIATIDTLAPAMEEIATGIDTQIANAVAEEAERGQAKLDQAVAFELQTQKAQHDEAMQEKDEYISSLEGKIENTKTPEQEDGIEIPEGSFGAKHFNLEAHAENPGDLYTSRKLAAQYLDLAHAKTKIDPSYQTGRSFKNVLMHVTNAQLEMDNLARIKIKKS